MNPFNAQLDHIVIAAPTLEAGVQWCEKTLGVSPGPGGEHPHMGTHNRLLRITSEAFQGAYLEIIAIAPHMPAPAAQARWFDLDNPVLQQRLQTSGPQLVNWVASVGPGQIQNAVSQWRGLGIDAGEPTAVSRMTPTGELRWQFSIRGDGQRPANGALPHLIEWGKWLTGTQHAPQPHCTQAAHADPPFRTTASGIGCRSSLTHQRGQRSPRSDPHLVRRARHATGFG